MKEENKVLTPEYVNEQIGKLWDSWLSDEITVEEAKEEGLELIREYGEQQYTIGSHGLFKEIAKNDPFTRRVPGSDNPALPSLSKDDDF
jgi:hypothetical protein